MKHTVYAHARVEADSLGAAEEIAANEEVQWEVGRTTWKRRASRALTTLGLGWIVTSPWDVGASEVVTAHLGIFRAALSLVV